MAEAEERLTFSQFFRGAAEQDRTATLDTFSAGLGAYASNALARCAFLSFVMSMFSDNSKEEHRANPRAGGHFIIPLEIQTKRIRILELLQEHFVAQVKFGIQPVIQHGDEIIPVATSLATTSLDSRIPASPQIITRTELLIKQLEVHALSAVAFCPREDVYSFINSFSLDVSVPEWSAVTNRLSNYGSFSAPGHRRLLCLR